LLFSPSPLLIFSVVFACYGAHRALHSFPTRRSSDLVGRADHPTRIEGDVKVSSWRRGGSHKPARRQPSERPPLFPAPQSFPSEIPVLRIGVRAPHRRGW